MISAPGRVNLIGEHIDYHGLPVLPMALRRSIRVQFQVRGDRRIQAVSEDYGGREFEWTPDLTPVARGDWENYLRAAAQAVTGKWGVLNGIDAAIESDLPPAAGLSSSSALLVAFTLALLRANRREATFEELDGDSAGRRAFRGHPWRRNGSRGVPGFTRRLRIADRVHSACGASHPYSRGLGVSGGA